MRETMIIENNKKNDRQTINTQIANEINERKMAIAGLPLHEDVYRIIQHLHCQPIRTGVMWPCNKKGCKQECNAYDGMCKKCASHEA